MFEEYEGVRLKHDLPEYGLKAGARGTIVMVHTVPSRGYEVEMQDDEGWVVDVLTLKDDDLIVVSADELHRDEAA